MKWFVVDYCGNVITVVNDEREARRIVQGTWEGGDKVAYYCTEAEYIEHWGAL